MERTELLVRAATWVAFKCMQREISQTQMAVIPKYDILGKAKI